MDRGLTIQRTIGIFGGMCLLVNAMTGPSIPYTAHVFSTSGWLSVLFLFLSFGILSTFCALFIVQSMQAIPGNKHFQGQVEYGTLINFYFGKWMHLIGQSCLYAAVQSTAIQCIVLTSQTFDSIMIEWFGRACGFSFSQGWTCATSNDLAASPFSSLMLFTAGFLITIGLSIPLGLADLDNNIMLQIASFGISTLFVIQWVVASVLFITTNNDPGLEPPPIKAVTNDELPNAVGTILLSVAFTFVVPSWINVKAKHVNVQGTLWLSSFTTVILYIMVGLFRTFHNSWPAALAFLDRPDGNILPSISEYGIPSSLSKYTSYLFAIIMLLPAIPVASIVSYQNFVQNDVFSKRTAAFMAYFVPWVASIPFLNGKYTTLFITWTSLLFVSTANFIIPLLIYFKCRKFRTEYNETRRLTRKQLKLLKLIHHSSGTIQQYIDQRDLMGEEDVAVRKSKDVGRGGRRGSSETIGDEPIGSDEELMPQIPVPIITVEETLPREPIRSSNEASLVELAEVDVPGMNESQISSRKSTKNSKTSASRRSTKKKRPDSDLYVELEEAKESTEPVRRSPKKHQTSSESLIDQASVVEVDTRVKQTPGKAMTRVKRKYTTIQLETEDLVGSSSQSIGRNRPMNSVAQLTLRTPHERNISDPMVARVVTLRRGIKGNTSEFKTEKDDSKLIGPLQEQLFLSPLLLQQVPDPEREDYVRGKEKIEDRIGKALTLLTRRTNNSSNLNEQPEQQEMDELNQRRLTIPWNPAYISPAFRVIPSWIPIKEVTVARISFSVLSVVVFVNIILALVSN